MRWARSAIQRGVGFNIEGNPFAPPRPGYPGLLALCEAVRPAQITLVPDGDGIHSDHGFDFARDGEALRPLVAMYRQLGCRVSVFVDVGDPLVEHAARARPIVSGLYTGPFAEACASGHAAAALRSRRGDCAPRKQPAWASMPGMT